MKVYKLELEIMFALEDNQFYSNVYSTMEKAIEEGKYNLEKRMRDFYTNGYQMKGQDNITTDKLFSIERADYIFKVVELEIEYAENFNTNLTCEELWKVKPTHIEYYYDYKGELESKHIQWKVKQRTLKEEIRMNKEDLVKGAGTKFKVGDIVIVNSEFDKNLTYKKLFVIKSVPTKIDGIEYFKNRYKVISTYDREALLSGIFTLEYNENELRKYDKKIKHNSPINLLQRIILGDISVSHEMWQDMENGVVSFDERINYQEYLREVLKGEKINENGK